MGMIYACGPFPSRLNLRLDPKRTLVFYADLMDTIGDYLSQHGERKLVLNAPCLHVFKGKYSKTKGSSSSTARKHATGIHAYAQSAHGGEGAGGTKTAGGISPPGLDTVLEKVGKKSGAIVNRWFVALVASIQDDASPRSFVKYQKEVKRVATFYNGAYPDIKRQIKLNEVAYYVDTLR